MEVIKLEVSNKIRDKLLSMLNQFKPEDLKIIRGKEGNQKFLQEKAYLDEQLDEIDSGKAKFISLEEFNLVMEERIKKYGSKDS